MSWIGLAAAVFGVAGVLGAAYAVFTSTRTSRTLELLKGEAEAEKIRGDRLERDNTTLKIRVQGLEEANKVLVENLAGVTALKDLEAAIDSWRTESVAAISTWRTEVSGLLNAMIEKQGDILDLVPKRTSDR